MKALKLTVIACSLAVCAGCTMAPKYERPAAPVAATFPTGEAYKDVMTTASPLPDWKVFITNPKAKKVVEMALANNRDLRVAILNIEKARAAYGIQRSALMPSVAAGLQENAGKTPSMMSATGSSYVSHTYQANLASTAWELDLFGRVRSLSEAALQQFFSAEENRAAAQNALIAQVATSWINLGAQKEFLRLQKITLQSQEESFKLMSDSYRLGASSLLELEQARTTVATARAAVAQYERSLAQAQNALNLVVGSQVPADLEPNNLEEATNYGAIAPAGLSSDILLNRPDIKAAEHDLMSANANIGAARANFFPRISLTAGIGSSSRHLSDLFDAGTGLWTFAPSVSLPIFTGGANLSTLRQAEAQQKIMVATYEKTVQNAFAEVSDALATVGTVNRQCAALKDLVNATETAYRLSQSRYKNGLDGFLTVLESQRQMVAAQTNYISAESNRLSSGVMLYKVLGGGSVIEPETRAAAQTRQTATPRLPLNRLRQFMSRAEAEMLKTRETRVEERKEEKRSEKRDRILRAAEAIFLDKGFHAASMNEIAEAANVSTPHLYNFYASKAALALAVQLKMGQETFDALKTAMSAGEKNPSCQSIFDSRRSSLMLTILTECTRNPEIKEKIKENGARLRKMISEAGGISPDDQEGQYRILCVMAMYLGMSISNIFTPVENRELMTKILAQAETCILPFCGDKGSKATVS